MMKKLTAVLAALLMLVSLCACTAAQPSSQGTPDELQTMLEDISLLPVGTMGVSLIATQKAAALLDWCTATDMTQAEVTAAVQAYYASLDADSQAMYVEQVYYIVDCGEALSDDSRRAGMLESAGLSKKLSWEDAAFTLLAAMKDGVIPTE